MSKVQKYTVWLMTAMLLLFAAVQFNDPDPWVWIALYVWFALLGVGFLAGRFSLWITALSMAVAIGWAYYQWPQAYEGFGSSMKTLNQELARESGGLIICAAWAGVLMLFHRRNSG